MPLCFYVFPARQRRAKPRRDQIPATRPIASKRAARWARSASGDNGKSSFSSSSIASPAAKIAASGSECAPPAGSGVAAASSEIHDVAKMKAAGYSVVPYTVSTTPSRFKSSATIFMAAAICGALSRSRNRIEAPPSGVITE